MKNSNEINLIRTLAIISVIFYHISGQGFFSNEHFIRTLNIIIFQLTYIGVPLFIFISGFCLSSKYWENFSISDFFKKRFKTVLIPFFFFYCLYIFAEKRPLINIFYFILAPHSVSLHFWFIPLILRFYLIYPILIWIVIKLRNYLFQLFMISIIIQIIWLNFLPTIINPLPETLIDIIYFWIVYYSILSHISYFLFGVYLNKNNPKMHDLFIILTMIFLFYSTNGRFESGPFYTNPFDTITNLLLIFILYKLVGILHNFKTAFFNITAFLSYGVYLLHELVSSILIFWLKSIGITINDWVFYILLFLLLPALSFFAIWSFSHFPNHQYIIGKRINKYNFKIFDF